jgi:transcription elongation factor Elf1
MLTSDRSFAPIYACLHARFALEALAYDRLQDYLFEVSASAMKGWTLRQVLTELLYTDPDACSPTEVKIGWRPDPDAPIREIDLGESYSFSALWANKMHHALSSFLHEPTIKQMGEMGAESGAKAREKAEEALLELDRVLASSFANFRAHRLIRSECKCGSPIVRDLEFIEAGKVVSCSACGRLYNSRFDESRCRFEFWPQQATWTCKGCGHANSADAYELRSATTVKCEGCGQEFEISRDPVLKPISRAAAAAD